MPRVHINIGTNLGDRNDNIGRAVEQLRQLAHSVLGSTVSTDLTGQTAFAPTFPNSISEIPSHSPSGSTDSTGSTDLTGQTSSPSVPLDPDFRVSSIIETQPWGFTSENRFLNVGVSFNTKLSPPTLLDTLLTIQRTLSDAPHRGLCGGYIDRLIDLDLIFYGAQTVGYPPSSESSDLIPVSATSTDLLIPHPRMHLREFVLRPMIEIDPDWRHPLLHLTPSQLLDLLLHTNDSDVWTLK